LIFRLFPCIKIPHRYQHEYPRQLGNDKKYIDFPGKEKGCEGYAKADIIGSRADRITDSAGLVLAVHCIIADEVKQEVADNRNESIYQYLKRIFKDGGTVPGGGSQENNDKTESSDQRAVLYKDLSHSMEPSERKVHNKRDNDGIDHGKEKVAAVDVDLACKKQITKYRYGEDRKKT